MAPTPISYSTRALHDIALCYFLQPFAYISNNTAHIVHSSHDNKTCTIQTLHVDPINSNTVWALSWHSRLPHEVHAHDM
jgi:hypothetical protein